jgi:hypothetical protein
VTLEMQAAVWRRLRLRASTHLHTRSQELAQPHAGPQLRPLLHRILSRHEQGVNSCLILVLQVLNQGLVMGRAA